MTELVDAFGRTIRDLRISITDRCNFRCLYCLPETEEAADFFLRQSTDAPVPIAREWKPREHFLNYEEITRIVRIGAGMGISKIRITGGEPLLRRDVPRLIEQIAGVTGIEDLALTTNGFHFGQQGEALRAAGLGRVSFSLDSLDRANFKKLTGRDGLNEMLAAIEQAKALGFAPVKVNAVIIRGLNDHEVEPLARFARDENLVMRFIEFMALDSGRSWSMEKVVTASEMKKVIEREYELVREVDGASSTSMNYRFASSKGRVGFIASVSQSFCHGCNRLRVLADGTVRPCLFSDDEWSVRGLLRSDVSDGVLKQFLRDACFAKSKGHSMGQEAFMPPMKTMSTLGG